MPRSHASKRPPWNERVVHCVVNHLIPTVKPYAGHTTDKLVLIFAARHAHPAGCGITVTRDTLADGSVAKSARFRWPSPGYGTTASW